MGQEYFEGEDVEDGMLYYGDSLVVGAELHSDEWVVDEDDACDEQFEYAAVHYVRRLW